MLQIGTLVINPNEWYFRVAGILLVASGANLVVHRMMRTWLAQRSRLHSDLRNRTLGELLSHAITFVIGVLVAALVLGVFVPASSLLTFLGLFSAALGLGARPLVSDYMTGFMLIFEDQFAVGEKVEIAGVRGFVEGVTLRTTSVRAESGEVYIVPNGDVRNVRNFSRASFSPANVVVKVPTDALPVVMAGLQRVIDQIVADDPPPIEPPLILSEHGVVGPTTELTLVVKAPYSHGPSTRTRIIERLQRELRGVLGDTTIRVDETPEEAAPAPEPVTTRPRAGGSPF